MLERNKTDTVFSPCLILAHPHVNYEALLARAFRRLGWDVYLTRSGPEARRLARMLEADVVILHADLPEESGWLTCDKLTREQPFVRVILVSDDVSPLNRELASFVGASVLVNHADGLAPLIEELAGTAVHAAS
ncbi:MAG TPA: response regulator [Gemmataceae bacterium]|nr:response regulator [Gemmataceae bacterium]